MDGRSDSVTTSRQRPRFARLADKEFPRPRHCMRELVGCPVQEADYLNRAADEHLGGNRRRAEQLLAEADRPAVQGYTEMLWGSDTIKELGLLDPRLYPRVKSDWGGLDRILKSAVAEHIASNQQVSGTRRRLSPGYNQ